MPYSIATRPLQESIGAYAADVYAVDGLCVVSHKRREHLSADDLKNNKSLLTNFQRGKLTDADVQVSWGVSDRGVIVYPVGSNTRTHTRL